MIVWQKNIFLSRVRKCANMYEGHSIIKENKFLWK